MEVDILFPGRLKLPRTQTPELDPDFYLSVTKKQQTSTEINYPFDITLDYLAKTVFYKYVKSIDELIHDGPHSTILLVELIKPIDHEDTVVQKCVVKVCKPCYDERFHSKNKHTSKCLSKADRARTEFDILKRMQKVGIRVPTMYTCQKNVIFMSDMKAPKNQLKYFISSKHDVSIVYQQLVEMMTLFYRKAKLVHKYVSKMNIVVDDQFNCWFLDVGSTIDGAQSEALDSLMTDCIKNEQVLLKIAISGQITLVLFFCFFFFRYFVVEEILAKTLLLQTIFLLR